MMDKHKGPTTIEKLESKIKFLESVLYDNADIMSCYTCTSESNIAGECSCGEDREDIAECWECHGPKYKENSEG